jgi:nitroreductase
MATAYPSEPLRRTRTPLAYVVAVDLPLTAREVLTTTRAVRKRLDLERPVPRAVVEDCMQIAFQAPNGSNQQMWNWVVVDDPDRRAAMADVWRGGMADHIGRMDSARERGTGGTYAVKDRQAEISSSVMYLREHLHEVPVLVVPTVEGRSDGWGLFDQASRWGSILPAVWNFMLALRLQGLGSVWTTIHLHREAEMAELLGIPVDRVTQAGLFPVAYTIGTDFRPANRSASDESIHWNQW